MQTGGGAGQAWLRCHAARAAQTSKVWAPALRAREKSRRRGQWPGSAMQAQVAPGPQQRLAQAQGVRVFVRALWDSGAVICVLHCMNEWHTKLLHAAGTTVVLSAGGPAGMDDIFVVSPEALRPRLSSGLPMEP